MTENLPAKPEDDPRHATIAKALEQLLEGKSISQIADALQVKRSTLHSWLLGQVPEKYKHIQEQGLIARIVAADEDIDNATSHLDVARAREKARFARWDAERRLSNLFAPRQEISGPGGGPIPLQLDNHERARRGAFIRALVDEPQDAEILSESSRLSPGSTDA